MTKILADISERSLKSAAARLHAGDLVAFPTETVYGLGANAHLQGAVSRVFEIKGRPAQDPLIVHFAGFEETRKYLSTALTDWQFKAYEALGRAFWPGSLTLILPCDTSKIVPAVSAGTGWVGLRCPRHPVAQRFLALCDCPVAAPSANLFGHVSPTTAQHVVDDFPSVDNLWIVDGGACGVGIESTVVKLTGEDTVDILRRGAIGSAEINSSLLNAGLISRTGQMSNRIRVIERFIHSDAQDAQLTSPGQLLVHYAPRVFTAMVTLKQDVLENDRSPINAEQLKKTVIIDFHGQLKILSRYVGAYRDLSNVGNCALLANGLFSSLRWAETLAGGDPTWQVWLFNPKLTKSTFQSEVFLAVADRIYRAASGRNLSISVKPGSDQVSF